MKKITFTILLFSSLGAFAQNVTREDWDKEIKSLTEMVKTLQSENSELKSDISKLKSEIKLIKSENSKLKSEISSELKMANKSIDTLRCKTQKEISQKANELETKIKETGNKNEGKITEVSELLSKKSLYGIIGVLSAILFSGLLYWLLSKRQQTDKTDFIERLSKTKSSIEESLVKEFGKQTELMEAQLSLIESQKKNLFNTANSTPNHSLPLKVADELALIERNLSLMDSSTKGLKQLSRSVEKIKDNLSANGYEIPVLLGKPFNQGMKIVPVSTIPDESLEAGVEIITRIIKPQVNYNDKMIQAAQIEVSVGY